MAYRCPIPLAYRCPFANRMAYRGRIRKTLAGVPPIVAGQPQIHFTLFPVHTIPNLLYFTLFPNHLLYFSPDLLHFPVIRLTKNFLENFIYLHISSVLSPFAPPYVLIVPFFLTTETFIFPAFLLIYLYANRRCSISCGRSEPEWTRRAPD
jgi:hypothetical protein